MRTDFAIELYAYYMLASYILLLAHVYTHMSLCPI